MFGPGMFGGGWEEQAIALAVILVVAGIAWLCGGRKQKDDTPQAKHKGTGFFRPGR